MRCRECRLARVLEAADAQVVGVVGKSDGLGLDGEVDDTETVDVDEAARELRRPALEVVVSHTLAHDDVTSQGSRAVLHDAKICLS